MCKNLDFESKIKKLWRKTWGWSKNKISQNIRMEDDYSAKYDSLEPNIGAPWNSLAPYEVSVAPFGPTIWNTYMPPMAPLAPSSPIWYSYGFLPIMATIDHNEPDGLMVPIYWSLWNCMELYGSSIVPKWVIGNTDCPCGHRNPLCQYKRPI